MLEPTFRFVRETTILPDVLLDRSRLPDRIVVSPTIEDTGSIHGGRTHYFY